MTVEANKALVRQFLEEVWNKGNMAKIDEYLSPDFVYHTIPFGLPSSLEGYKQHHNMLWAAHSNIHTSIEDMIAEGDKVVMRFRWVGTHTGEFLGIPPTGKQITNTGIIIYRLAGGKIVDQWDEKDLLGVMQQLGIVPPPGQGK